MKLLVVVVLFGLDYEHRNGVIVDVVDDAVVRCNVSGIGHIVSTDKRLRMPKSSAWMHHDVQ